MRLEQPLAEFIFFVCFGFHGSHPAVFKAYSVLRGYESAGPAPRLSGYRAGTLPGVCVSGRFPYKTVSSRFFEMWLR